MIPTTITAAINHSLFTDLENISNGNQDCFCSRDVISEIMQTTNAKPITAFVINVTKVALEVKIFVRVWDVFYL